jgi:hypothetical protein
MLCSQIDVLCQVWLVTDHLLGTNSAAVNNHTATTADPHNAGIMATPTTSSHINFGCCFESHSVPRTCLTRS